MRRLLLAVVLAVSPLIAWQAADPAPAAADAYPGANGRAYVLGSSGGNGDIFSINGDNLTSSTFSPLVTADDVTGMSVSPDGRRIAYTTTAPDRIYVMDLFTKVPVDVTPVGTAQYFSPTWSPNGQFIAYSRLPLAGVYQMVVSESTGTNATVITTIGQPETVTWHPVNPALIAYVDNVGGTIRTKNLVADTDIASGFQANDRLAYSPDGTEIYFVSRTNGQAYRFVDTPTPAATQLTFAPTINNVRGISPSPDGTSFLFRWTGGGFDNISRADLTGTLLQTTGTNTSSYETLTWGPAIVPGYRMVASDGGIFAFGSAGFEGSTGNIALNRPIVGMATTPSGLGYWLVSSDGGIFTFGDASFLGSTGALILNRPIVGMATTPSGLGYWLVSSDGGIFTFGDATFYGSTGAINLNQPIVGMAATPTGLGYWLVASDGGIFSFGDATFLGSTGNLVLNRPIVGMAAAPNGSGYWLVASDGGIFTFGSTVFYGSTGAINLNRPIVGMLPTPTGLGYWLVASDGGIFSFGDATFVGSTGNIALNQPIVGMGG